MMFKELLPYTLQKERVKEPGTLEHLGLLLDECVTLASMPMLRSMTLGETGRKREICQAMSLSYFRFLAFPTIVIFLMVPETGEMKDFRRVWLTCYIENDFISEVVDKIAKIKTKDYPPMPSNLIN